MIGYSLYEEVVPPTAIQLTLPGNFTSKNPQLLVSKFNRLEIYTISDALSFVCEYPMHGEIQAI